MHRLKQPGIFGLPNMITIGRLLVIPLIVYMLYQIRHVDTRDYKLMEAVMSLTTAGLFAFAMASDLVDGYLARRWNIVSTFGKFLDPLADKLLFLVAAIMMIPLGRIPAWMVVVFFLREMTVTALRSMAIEYGIVIAASKWGKYKSACMSGAGIGLLIYYPMFGIQWKLLGWIFLWPALILSFISGIDYCVGFYKEIKQKERAGA